MRYWHYLRESFESSLIYFHKWSSHNPQHVNIISNKLHHTSQTTATQHMCLCSTVRAAAPVAQERNALAFLCSPSTLKPLHWRRSPHDALRKKTLLFLCPLRWGSIVTFLLRPFSGRLSSMSARCNIGKARASSGRQSVHFPLADCENVRVSTTSY